jgi:phage I-like protein
MPEANENHEKFMARCVADPLMQAENPDGVARQEACQMRWNLYVGEGGDSGRGQGGGFQPGGSPPPGAGPGGGGGSAGAVGGQPKSAFQLIPFGSVQTEPTTGAPMPAYVFTAETARKLVAWFAQLRRPLAIDYEHQSYAELNPRADGLAPAAGWIGRLEVRTDGLWAAAVEWTAQAAALLASGAYRYFSPVFLWADATRKEIQALGPVALTNKPALHGVAALAASGDLRHASAVGPFAFHRGTEPRNTLTQGGMYMPNIREALGLQADATEDVILQAIDTLKRQGTSTITQLATALEVQADSPEQLVSALRSKLGHRPAEVTALRTQVTELQTTVSGLREANQRSEFNALLASPPHAGKIEPAKRDEFYTLYTSDPKLFATVLATLPMLVSATSAFEGGATSGVAGGADRTTLIAAARRSFAGEQAGGKTVLCTEEAWVNTALRDRKQLRLSDNEVVTLGVMKD